MKRIVMVPLIFLAAVAAGVFVWQKAQRPISVAVVTRSSSGSVVGSSEVNAGTLFIEETPGSPIAILALDDQWDTTLTRCVISEARARGERFFITSHPSKCAVEVADLFADDTEALMVVTASATDKLTGHDDGILRVVSDVAREQQAIARHVMQSGARRILVVQDTGNRPYTDPAYRVFSQELAGHSDIQISRREILVSDYHPDDLELFFADSADLLYILAGSYQPTVGIIAQLFHLQHPQAPILLTPWTRSPTILETAGPAAERMILPSHYPSRHEDTAVGSYVTRFRDRFSYDPISMSIAVRQSLELLDAAFRAGNHTPLEVKQYLLNQSPHKTSIGSISFDRNGDATSEFYFITDIQKEFAE